MSFNLTSQQIKDTYEQLAQVSASLLVNGTGSLSPIVTSSIINFPTEVSRSAAAAGLVLVVVVVYLKQPSLHIPHQMIQR